MNHLKYVLSTNVPRRVPSNAGMAARCCYQNEAYFKGQEPRSHVADKKFHDLKGPRVEGERINDDTRRLAKRNSTIYEQRVKPRLSVISSKRFSTDKKLSAESVQRTPRHYSTGRALKCSSSGGSGTARYFDKRGNERSRQHVKELKQSKIPKKNLPLAPHEKESRSYAQMIADYSETTYVPSSSAVLQDNNHGSGVGNGIRRSPFSTLSIVTGRQTDAEAVTNGPPFHENSVKVTSAGAKFSENAVARKNNSVNGDAHLKIEDSFEANREPPRSYANMIATYSDGMEFNEAEKNHNKSIKGSGSSKPNEDTLPGRKVGKTMISSDKTAEPSVESRKQTDWLKKVESIIADLRQAAAKADITSGRYVQKLQETRKPSTERDHPFSAGRILSNRKSPRDKNAPIEEQSKPQELMQQSKNDDRLPNSAPPQPINRETGSKTKKDSTRTTNTVAYPQEEPRVELRMTPNQNESIVSVNVNKMPKNPGRFGAEAKELSITVRSNRNKGQPTSTLRQQAETIQDGTSPEFGSMHISISEESVPVKQIEFSLNGKPVSELKHIIARVEKLDVVSSLDKIEIKIPMGKEGARLAHKHGKSLPKSGRQSDSILNLQISAKLDNKLADSNPQRSFGEHQVGTIKKTVIVPKTEPSFAENVGEKDRNERIPSGPDEHNVKIVDLPSVTKIYTSESIKNEMRSKSDESSGQTRREAMLKKSEETAPKKQTPSRRSEGVDNTNRPELPDERTPSGMIPWWSSEDAFNRIRRKGNTKKSKSASASGQRKIASPRQTETTTRKPGDSVGNEDVITGQAVPERKDAAPARNDDGTRLKVEEDKKKAASTSKSMPGNEKKTGQEKIEEIDADVRKECSINTKPGESTEYENIEKIMKRDTGVAKEVIEERPLKKPKSGEGLTTPEMKLKRILESMKPIEKRPDGTLIDYGIKVPSRRKQEKRGSKSRDWSKSFNLKEKDAVGPKVKTALDQAEPKVKTALDQGEPKIKTAFDQGEPKIKTALDQGEPKIKTALDQGEPKIKTALDQGEPKIKTALDQAGRKNSPKLKNRQFEKTSSPDALKKGNEVDTEKLKAKDATKPDSKISRNSSKTLPSNDSAKGKGNVENDPSNSKTLKFSEMAKETKTARSMMPDVVNDSSSTKTIKFSEKAKETKTTKSSMSGVENDPSNSKTVKVSEKAKETKTARSTMPDVVNDSSSSKTLKSPEKANEAKSTKSTISDQSQPSKNPKDTPNNPKQANPNSTTKPKTAPSRGSSNVATPGETAPSKKDTKSFDFSQWNSSTRSPPPRLGQVEKPLEKARPSGTIDRRQLPGDDKPVTTTTTTTTDAPPLKGTVNEAPARSTNKPARHGNTSSIATSRSGSADTTKKTAVPTGTAPLAGTVVRQPSIGLTKTVGADTGKKENAGKKEPVKSGKNEISPAKEKTTGPSKSMEGAGVPTGPAGLKRSSSKDFVAGGPTDGLNRKSGGKFDKRNDAPVKPGAPKAIGDTKKMHLNMRADQTINRGIGSYVSGGTERPEKDILYSVWLHRFTSNPGDEKAY